MLQILIKVQMLTSPTIKGKITNVVAYHSSDHVMVRNGEYLSITHTGTCYIGKPSRLVPLKNVLLVPAIKKSFIVHLSIEERLSMLFCI